MNDDSAPSDRGSGPANEKTYDRLDIQHWYRRVYAQCRAKLISASDSEDATQETFLRALARLDELRVRSAMGGWLRRIARNVCVDTIRRQQVRRTEPMTSQCIAEHCSENRRLAEGEAAPDAERNERHAYLIDLIERLPEPQREVVFLHYYEKMTYDQMAEWLGVARSTVNDRLSKARKTLKQALELTGNEP